MNASTYRQFNVIPAMILLLIAGSIMLMATTINIHAVEKHGSKAAIVVQCIDAGKPTIKLTNNETNRIGYCVEVEPTLFGIYITMKDGTPITAFLKDKMKLLSDVIRYMANRGYVP